MQPIIRVERVGRAITEQAEQSDAEILLRLNSRDAERSAEAARELRSLAPYRLSSLVLCALQMQNPVFHHARAFAALPVLLILAAVAHAGVVTAAAMLGLLLICAGVLLIILRISCYAPANDMSECFRLLTLHIGALDSVEMLPTLLMLRGNERTCVIPAALRRSVRAALQRILPRVTENEFSALGTNQRHVLLWILQTPYEDTRLTVTVIDVLARLANPFDRDLLARLQILAGEGTGTANMRQVRSMSQKALHHLEERRSKQLLAGSLLRASDMQASWAPHELLRPGGSAGTVPPEMMVRASDTPRNRADA